MGIWYVVTCKTLKDRYFVKIVLLKRSPVYSCLSTSFTLVQLSKPEDNSIGLREILLLWRERYSLDFKKSDNIKKRFFPRMKLLVSLYKDSTSKFT